MRGDMRMEGRLHGQLWRHALRGIAIIAGAAPAVMNVAGCLESFTDPFLSMERQASVCALISTSWPAPLRFVISGRRSGSGFYGWESPFGWAAQQPVEEQKKTGQQQKDLETERGNLTEAQNTALHGQDKEMRANAKLLA